MQRRRAGIDADRVGDAEIVGRRLLKLCDERAEGERIGLEQAMNIGQGFFFDLPLLNGEIGERNA
jgi:hypothetical protein